MSMEIRFLEATEAEAHLDALAELLRDSVDSGASVGFLPPLEASEARAFWEGVIAGVASGARSLAVARLEGQVAGTVQWVRSGKTNAPHRAEVSKLLVHSAFRRRGLGAALMRALEQRALVLGLSTLVLDTREGDPSEQLYQSLGWVRSGVIPHYVQNAEGVLQSTVVYYKLLGRREGSE